MCMVPDKIIKVLHCDNEMLDAIDKGESPTIIGDGTEAFDFISVRDCAAANVCAMKASTSDQFYNVGTGTKTSLKELAELIIKLTKCNSKITYKERSAGTFVKNRIGCPVKAKDEIGFSSKIKLEEGLKDLIEWRNNDKSGVKSRRESVKSMNKEMNIPIARTNLLESEITAVLEPLRSGWLVQGKKLKNLKSME